MAIHYSKAPIIEAVIDFQVKLPAGVTLPDLKKIYKLLKPIYPTKKDSVVFQSSVSMGAKVAASASQSQIGFALTSSDERQILQTRLNGFTFSRLPQYDKWESFRSDALSAWTVYCKFARPLEINRIATRYINRIDIPLPIGDFKDYLRTGPEISPDLSQALNGFYFEVHIPQDDIKSNLVIREAIIPSSKEDVVSVMLDIDVFSSVHIVDDMSSAWKMLDILRDRKNIAFEACITDKVRELIK